MKYSLSFWGTLLLALQSAASVSAVVVPAGLNPGDSYYLAFMTRNKRDATSADINVYNNFVQSQASLNPTLTGTNEGVEWRAVASTSTVNAIDNLGLDGSPIYLLNGQKLSSGNPWIGLMRGFSITQFLAQSDGNAAWTGTLTNGLKSPLQHLGSAGGSSIYGNDETVTTQWVQFSSTGSNEVFNFYAISSRITVPIPEPSTLALAGIGLLGAGLWRRRRRR